MFFNAPNVDSVNETNEIWVSTPPPDLIYLFKDDIFTKVLNNKYKISFVKTLSPLIILKKYINKFKNKKNNIYPRSFVSSKILSRKLVNKHLKKVMFIIIKTLVKIKILKHYSDDYGLVYQIKNKIIMLKITIPNNNIPERIYITDIILGEFLGLDYTIERGSENYEITLENGNQH